MYGLLSIAKYLEFEVKNLKRNQQRLKDKSVGFVLNLYLVLDTH